MERKVSRWGALLLVREAPEGSQEELREASLAVSPSAELLEVEGASPRAIRTIYSRTFLVRWVVWVEEEEWEEETPSAEEEEPHPSVEWAEWEAWEAWEEWEDAVDHQEDSPWTLIRMMEDTPSRPRLVSLAFGSSRPQSPTLLNHNR